MMDVRKRVGSLILAGLFLLFTASLARAQTQDAVTSYPALADPAAWDLIVQPGEGGAKAAELAGKAGVFAAGDGFVELRFIPGQNLRMNLKQPIALPNGVRDLTFHAANCAIARITVAVRHVIRDEAGSEYLYVTRGDLQKSQVEGQYSFDALGHRAREVRHFTPGLRYTDIQRTIHAPVGKGKPVGKLTWVGLLMETKGEIPPKDVPSIFFREFKARTLTPKQSTLHYQFANDECLGEVDGLPHLTPGRYWWWPGKYELSWTVRDRFDGQPFLAGSYSLDTSKNPEKKALGVQLADRIEIPVRTQGTYWVQVRVRRTDMGRQFKYYNRVTIEDLRLDVIRGDQSTAARTPVEPHTFDRTVTIAPSRESMAFSADEPFIVPVSFAVPTQFTKPLIARIIAFSVTTGEEVARWQEQLTPQSSEPRVVNFDLTKLGPGGYRIDASLIELLKDDQEGPAFDMDQRVVARRDKTLAKPAEIPSSVLSAADWLKRDEPMFHLDATYSGAERKNNPEEAWTKGFKPFLEEVGPVTRTIEFSVPWNMAEPLPGVYDWKEVDRFLDAAHAKGLVTLLRPEFTAASTPDWIKTDLIQDAEGYVFGHTAYLFHGMRPDYFYSPVLQSQLNRFLLAMVEHYRGHPGVQGYYLLLEHPGDSPWSGFFGGYEPTTIQAFRDALKKQYVTVQAMNTALGTSWKDWSAVMPPESARFSGSTEQTPPAFSLAWLRFKEDAISNYRKSFVEQTRKVDPKRLLMIYSTSDDAPWFAQRGCMTANGGTHEAHMFGYLGLALNNFQMRNEEITPARWSANGPYQLDASLFHASIAGGEHAHCKSFIDTSRRFTEVQGPPFSLGKFIQFQPLWRELRNTQLPQVQIFALVDRDGAMYEHQAVGIGYTAGGWGGDNFFANHLTVALGGMQQSANAKLVLATADYGVEWLTKETRDRVEQYVRNGGMLVMRADAGRKSFDKPQEDWVLLKQLGLPTPSGEMNHAYRMAETLASPEWTAPAGERFRLRDTWQAPADPEAQILARFTDGASTPAMSWRRVGKGIVIVQWAQTSVPSFRGGGYPVLAPIAQWAGVPEQATSDSPRLWTHLLTTKPGKPKAWHAAVQAGPWYSPPDDKPVSGRVRWPGIPADAATNFQVTELITGKDLGIVSVEQLRLKGLEVKLESKQVAFYRLTPLK